jgi:hypothetical protein
MDGELSSGPDKHTVLILGTSGDDLLDRPKVYAGFTEDVVEVRRERPRSDSGK